MLKLAVAFLRKTKISSFCLPTWILKSCYEYLFEVSNCRNYCTSSRQLLCPQNEILWWKFKYGIKKYKHYNFRCIIVVKKWTAFDITLQRCNYVNNAWTYKKYIQNNPIAWYSRLANGTCHITHTTQHTDIHSLLETLILMTMAATAMYLPFFNLVFSNWMSTLRWTYLLHYLIFFFFLWW